MVEWKKLGDVVSFFRGVTYNKKQEVEPNSGGIKILRANNISVETNSLILNDVKEISKEVKIKDYQWLFTNDILICAGSGSKEHVGKVAFIKDNMDYAYGGFMGKFVTSPKLCPRFFFHIISSTLFKKYLDAALNSTTINNLNANILNNFLIPIPSLSEQNRIVGILDTFTASIDNLKQQIEQRRKQYEYYRDQLLDLEGKEGVEMKKIGELFIFKNGLNKEKKYFGQGNPIVNYTDVYHNKSITKDILAGRVTLSENEIERYRVHRGDVFFTRTSETQEEIGYAAVMLEEVEKCTFSGFLLRARPITNLLLPEYCAYCFGSYIVRQNIIKYSTLTTRALTNGPSLSKIAIPVPSLSEQQRIVSILDTFEASIANLEQQLAQRQKQYEYYRNKLLTFE